MEISNKKRGRAFYYLGLIFVIFVWGTTPIAYSLFYKTYSPVVCSFMCSLSAAISLLIILRKKLHMINLSYLKVAVPTGLINAAASLVQKIGLPYTTPSRYAFLENLSCIVVPVMMFIFLRRKPTRLKIVAACLCLVGCFVLAGGLTDGSGFGIGEVLCALAGILYGVNIAATGAFATKLYAPLYVFLHMTVSVVTSGITFLALGNIKINGNPIEQIRFEWSWMILFIIVVALMANTVCWTIRTNVMKHLDATVVAIMMPFSAVVTGVISVLSGMDSLSLSLVLGALIVLAASILSGISKTDKSGADIPQTAIKNKNGHIKEK